MNTTPTNSAERKCRVVRGRQVDYPDPIAVEAHEPFAVSEKSEPWEDNPEWIWVWCTDQRGKGGWVPKNIIQMQADGKTGTTQAAYSARELPVNAGQELIIEQEEGGWLWCRDLQGKDGWVPVSHVTEL